MTIRLNATFDADGLARRIVDRLTYRFNDIAVGAGIVTPTEAYPLPLLDRLPAEVARLVNAVMVSLAMALAQEIRASLMAQVEVEVPDASGSLAADLSSFDLETLERLALDIAVEVDRRNRAKKGSSI